MSPSESNERIFDPTTYFLGVNRIQGLEQPSDIIHHILHRDKRTGLSRLVFNNLKARKRVDRTLIIDGSSLVVAIDGILNTPEPPQFSSTTNTNFTNPDTNPGEDISSSENTKTQTKVSYGIYFGPSSPHSKSSFLPPSSSTPPQTQTKETALLVGCCVGLSYILSNLLYSTTIPSSPLSLPSPISPLSQYPSPSPSLSPIPLPKSPLTKTIILSTSSLYLLKCMTTYVHIWEKNGYRDSKGVYIENWRELKELEGVIRRFEMRGVRVLFWLVGSAYVGEARVLAESAREEEKEEVVMNKEIVKVGTIEGEKVVLKKVKDLIGGRGREGNDEVEIVGAKEDMCDMEALELELEKGFVRF